MDLSGGAVVLLWLLIYAFRKNCFEARWHYSVLKVGILFLLVPMGVFLQPISTITGNDISVVSETVQRIQRLAEIVQNPVNSNELTEMIATKPTSLVFLEMLVQYVWLLWLVGVVTYFLYKLIAFRRLKRKILSRSESVASPEILAVLTVCKKELGVKIEVLVNRNSLVQTPFVTGLFKPTITIPDSDMTTSELRYVFLHELAHIKSGDLWFRCFALFAVAVHWYNPLSHILRWGMIEVGEQCCDEMVVETMSKYERRKYGNVILKMMGNTVIELREFCSSVIYKTKSAKEIISYVKFQKNEQGQKNPVCCFGCCNLSLRYSDGV